MDLKTSFPKQINAVQKMDLKAETGYTCIYVFFTIIVSMKVYYKIFILPICFITCLYQDKECKKNILNMLKVVLFVYVR